MWFSHLDLMRAMSRALRRSGLDIWMSEGYTPRPHIVFTPPLSLGFESTCEIMDFRLNLGATYDKDALMSCFPPALSVNDIYVPHTKQKSIVYADYTLTLDEYDDEKIRELFSKPVMMLKKTKRSEVTEDITTFIKAFEISGGIIKTTLCCNAERTLNPSYILKAIEGLGYDVSTAHVCRTAFRKENMTIFK